MHIIFAGLMLIAAADAQAIALNQIWACSMPGTRSVFKLDPNWERDRRAEIKGKGTDLRQILFFLSNAIPKEGERAGPALLVKGTGAEALANARAALVDKTNVAITPADNCTLLFYSHMCGRYVQIVSAERRGNDVTVKYKLVAHTTAEMTTDFALIPLGKFKPGVVNINIELQGQPDEIATKIHRRKISHSTTHEVKP